MTFKCDTCDQSFTNFWLHDELFAVHGKKRCLPCFLKFASSCDEECRHWKKLIDKDPICTTYGGYTSKYRKCFRKKL